MAPNPKMWFDIDSGLHPEEHQFLAAMREHARSWTTLGSSPDETWALAEDDFLALYVDIVAAGVTVVLRTLRIEFSKTGVLVGEDETGQCNVPFSKTQEGGVAIQPVNATVALYAERTAEWIEHQLRRVIKKHEWIRPEFKHRHYVLADTGEILSWADSQNQGRCNLGPPDKITVLRDFR